MKSLLLMRHAKSSWKQEGLADFDRPLNARGRRDAPEMAKRLIEAELKPDLLVCSTAVRAQETADLMIETMPYSGPARREQRLYLAAPKTILSVLSEIDAEPQRVLLIAHNPGLEELVSLLTGASRHMPTAAIAQLELPIDAWADAAQDVKARLVDFWTPKDETS